MASKILMSTKLKNMIEATDPTLKVELKNIRVNGDPRGCSGFIIDKQTGKHVYVNTEGSVYGPLQGKVLYREAKHTKDYTGGRNHWATPDTLVTDITNMLGK